MNHSFKKFIRDTLGNKGQFIAITSIIAIGIAFLTGLSVAYRDINDSIDDYYQNANLADYWFMYDAIDQSTIRDLELVEGVKNAEGRTKLMAATDNEKEILLHSTTEDTEINQPLVTEGQLPTGSDEIALDQDFRLIK
ncbi:hypothetical protein [Amphibacillus cookii]|uniref:hypothetical protein n=1 Tax=Amphibacillus cookii TaxID=767787 RepID=UPI00195E2075|nr:hypothetical protein [Amphibacillus cookii]MBM7541178.1 hypothetical protein [Amphibacillus cookii]